MMKRYETTQKIFFCRFNTFVFFLCVCPQNKSYFILPAMPNVYGLETFCERNLYTFFFVAKNNLSSTNFETQFTFFVATGFIVRLLFSMTFYLFIIILHGSKKLLKKKLFRSNFYAAINLLAFVELHEYFTNFISS